MSLFGESVPDPAPDGRMQDIRQAMLDCLALVAPNERTSGVFERVLRAPDIQSLWYLRADVMILLANLLGESHAHARLRPITDMFVGLLPAAQKARTNRLHN